jgi:hypothetical protein
MLGFEEPAPGVLQLSVAPVTYLKLANWGAAVPILHDFVMFLKSSAWTTISFEEHLQPQASSSGGGFFAAAAGGPVATSASPLPRAVSVSHAALTAATAATTSAFHQPASVASTSSAAATVVFHDPSGFGPGAADAASAVSTSAAAVAGTMHRPSLRARVYMRAAHWRRFIT